MREGCLSLFCALALLAGCQEPHALDRLPGGEVDEPPEAEAAPAQANRAVEEHRAVERPPQAPRPPQPEPIAAPADVAAPPATAERTESGIASRVLEPGTGSEHPGPTDGVTVQYTGWRAENGEMFDSSVTRGQPASFPLNRVIRGWTEGVQLMVVGEKRRLWIPPDLAYEGRQGPQGMLVFDVELLSINRAPPTPSDVSAPPANAERTDSGLASLRLSPGNGTVHPRPEDTVEVHYAGWRAEDGELFDTSYVRGNPATFPLNGVIAGWTEGVQLMVEGERRRFWIPANLAYEGRRGPQGMLVFDIELRAVRRAERAIPARP